MSGATSDCSSIVYQSESGFESYSGTFFPINLESATDLSRHYILNQKLPTPYQFRQVKSWDSFDDLILRNVRKLDRFSSNTNEFLSENEYSSTDLLRTNIDEAIQFVTRSSESILAENKINVSFSQSPGLEQVGKPSISLFNQDGEQRRPILVGLHTVFSKFSMISRDYFFYSLSTVKKDLIYYSSEDYTNASKMVRELCSHMVLNNLRYGYISTGSYTRFIKRSSSHDGDIEFSPAILLQTSLPYTIIEVFSAIARQCIFGDFDMNQNGYYLERDQNAFNFLPQTLPESDIHSLKRNDPVTSGKAKWRVKRQRDITFQLKFLKPTQPPFLNSEQPHTPGINLGTVIMTPPSTHLKGGRQPGSIKSPAVLKCYNYSLEADEEKLKSLELEAAMYEYLDWCKLENVPKRYIYGDVLRFLKVLALEPVGRPMCPADITGSTITKMKEAVSELHRHKILHHDIRLSKFCIDDDKRVRIIGFSRAKRYHILYDVAIQQEMNTVLDVISEGLEAASAFPEHI